MKGSKLKLIFKESYAYLTAGMPIALKALELPAYAATFRVPAFWTIEVLDYQPQKALVFARILKYEVGETVFPDHQQQHAVDLQQIRKIKFKSIDTNGLLRTIGPPLEKNAGLDSEVLEGIDEARIPERLKSTRRIIEESFSVPFKKVRFGFGGVSFDKKFDTYYKTLELTIPNYGIRAEFDAIKNYFANTLNTKKIQVSARILIVDDEIASSEILSPEIAKIDASLIDNVKFKVLQDLLKKKIPVDIDKSLFTMDEYFDTFSDDDFSSGAFYEQGKQLFDDILHISLTKHYKNLRYLSSRHAYDIMKLRFIHHPFSFLFLIAGERNYHIVWETLDTEEATYVWHVDKDLRTLKRQVRKIDHLISTIKLQGKTAYINSNEDMLRRIYHDYSDIVEGFVKWKGTLESVLI